MEFKTKDAYYLIEGEPHLSVVNKFIEDRKATHKAYVDYAQSKGATDFFAGFSGLCGLIFKPGEEPEGWTKPDRKTRDCRPKRGTEDYKEYAALPKMKTDADSFCSIQKLPGVVSYKHGNITGSTAIASGFHPVQYLYLSNNLRCVVIPDYEDLIDQLNAQVKEDPTLEIKNGLLDFKLDTTGLTKITKNQWILRVAQYEVEQEQNGK